MKEGVNEITTIPIESDLSSGPSKDSSTTISSSSGQDTIDESCKNCGPRNDRTREELSLSSVSDEDVGPSLFGKKRSGMHKSTIDVALLAANANQLRSTIIYGAEEKLYSISLVMLILSMIIHIMVGMLAACKRLLKKKGKRKTADKLSIPILIGCYFMSTVNVITLAVTMNNTNQLPNSDNGSRSINSITEKSH